MHILLCILNQLYLLFNKQNYRRFSKQAAFPKIVQEKILLGIIKKSKDTLFGQEHSFEKIHSIKDF